MSESEEYVKERTFECEILWARITPAQCRRNCVFATIEFYEKTNPHKSDQTDDEGEYWWLRHLGLWKDCNDNETVKCLVCKRYITPKPSEMRAVIWHREEYKRRYPDTKLGRVERELLDYTLEEMERINAEDNYNYHSSLSGSSPFSDFMADVYDKD